jgi:predicted Mrr-cat superfamily restriction endonuclease
MNSAWLVRSGENASEIAEMVTAGVIGVRYHQVSDVRQLSSEQIETAIRESGRTTPAARAARLMTFADTIAIGDLIVTPDAHAHEVWFAEVTGDYVYENPSRVPRYLHTREVRWLGAIDRDTDITQDDRKQLSQRITLYPLDDAAYWVERSGLATLDRPVAAKPAAKAPRKPPAVKPKPPAVPKTARCEICTYTVAAHQVVDGVCSSCRSMV